VIGGIFGFGEDSEKEEKPIIEEPGDNKKKGSLRSSELDIC
jgi:hypothetical protein